MKVQKQIRIAQYTPANGFIKDYQKLILDEVIPYQYAVLNDAVEGIPAEELSHVVKNFENAAKALKGEDVGDGFFGMVFQDSDAAKWLEAVAYALNIFKDKELEAKADELIDKIAAAQDVDGYLNTYYTIKDREKRFTNLLEGHELYCSGHFMEAAVAYYDATGKDTLLKVMLRNVECIYNHFVVGDREGYPGHPEVELALLKMYRATGNKHCLELAKRFIDKRGTDNYFKEEVEKRDWTVWGNNAADANYQQSGAPVREQKDATGHSVRAVYLYTGMADLAALTDDKELFDACKTLWNSIVNKRMYVTGAIGSTTLGEAFTVDYDLPNDTAYAETCASCGLMFFASRMLENEVDSRYADIMERAFYNTVLAGMSQDGKKFFYVNPLEVIPGVSGVACTHMHDKPVRPGWFTCACCPPNVARTITGIGMYAYGSNDTTAFAHLYAAGSVSFDNGISIEVETAFPYGNTVKYKVTSGSGKLAVRMPGWSKAFEASKTYEEKNGYAYFDITAGTEIEVKFNDDPRYVYANAKVFENTGCVAVEKGVLVYCVEGVDNKDDVLSLKLTDEINVLEDSCGEIKLKGYRSVKSDNLYSYDKPVDEPEEIKAIPYYKWCNRGLNEMRVWLPVK